MKLSSKKLDTYLKDRELSGVVSVTEGVEILYQKAFGYRDMPNKTQNQIDTKFGIASGTKLFTALGIGALIGQGELALDTKVSEIDASFCSFIDPDATILNLLTHTSGIFDYYDEEVIEDFDNFYVDIPWYNLHTPLDYLPLFTDQKMKFAPNARFSYSNGGFVFLGILIELITKMHYRDFIYDEVLKPAGMLNSGFFATNELPANTANGYQKDSQKTNIFNLPIRGAGDGGMYTTALDMQAFWSSYMSFDILKKELTENFLETQHHFDEVVGYGCGIYKYLDNSCYLVIGSDAGVGFTSHHYPKSSLTISVLSNRTDGETGIRQKTQDLLID
ncbi:MAG: beta-lactamase family protein [Chloroflexi bacterium]|nr:beta-lactamase family protein [Chloroflexota bacterium]